MSAPKESPIGSWPLPTTPVDFPPMRGAMCPQGLHGDYAQTPVLGYSLRPLNRHDSCPLSIVFRIPDPLQLWQAPLNPETCSKSAGCRPAARRLTESLVLVGARNRHWRNRDMLQARNRMSRALQIGFVAIALLFAQLQCVAACASQFCGGDFKTDQVPPCHRHHDRSHDQVPGSCVQQITVPTAPHTLQADAPILSVLSVATTMSPALPAGTRTAALDLSAFSPSELKSPSSIVLRV
jgi:hypothetical protein